MKKLLLLGMSAFVLAACGNGTQEQVEADTESSTEQTESTSQENTSVSEESSTQETDATVIELNQNIVDDENIKADLVSVEKYVDDLWGETIEVKFDVTNNTDSTITVQAREVSIDDRMVDESLQFMSQEVSSGKSAEAILTLQDVSGETELPELTGNFDMLLHVFSYDDETYETLFENDYQVSAELN